MKDWRQLAKAANVDITAEELERIVPILKGLENAYRPLTKKIPLGTEPALIFQPERREEQ